METVEPDQEPGWPLTTDGGDPPVADVVVVDDEQATWVRRPVDGLRLLLGIPGFVLLLVLADLAVATSYGVQSDVGGVGRLVPGVVIRTVYALTSLLLLFVPVALVAQQALLRRWRQIAEALLAGALGLLLSYAFSAWVLSYAPAHLRPALVVTPPGGAVATASFLTAFAAFVLVLAVNERPGWWWATWGAVAAESLAAILAGSATPLGAVVTLLLGRMVGIGLRYALGAANTRPPARTVAESLRGLGLDPVRCTRSTRPEPYDRRRYDVVLRDGAELDLVVLDRDQQGAGVLYRLYRWLRVRSPAPRSTFVSLRQALEHQALLAYAAAAAGVRTQRLVGTSRVGPDAAVLVLQSLEALSFRRPFPQPADVVPDEQLVEAWRQVARLHAARIAHRSLAMDRFAVDTSGRVWVLGLHNGDVAASDLLLRLDVAQLLADTAVAVGVDRAVTAAAAGLGTDRLAAAVPFLQPVALTGPTRRALRGRRELVGELRDRVSAQAPTVPAEPLRIERLGARTLLTFAATTVAAYILLGQLASVDLRQVVLGADWRWALAALGFSAATYAAAALAISGWVAERLRFARTLLVQVAASFVTLVAPASVGGVALNARYLQRSGVPPASAVASVGVSQLGGLALHLLLLVLFGFLTGTQASHSFGVPGWVYAAGGVVAALALAVLAVPRTRRMLRARLRPLVSQALPRLLEVLQSPAKLAQGVGGALLLTAAYVLCLDAAVQAFGGSLGIASIAFVYLAGSAVGSVAPTPGGLGAVEAALAAGLTAAGLASETAVSAVLLFRVVSFWLPVLPGWLAFSVLQRQGHL